MTEQAKAQHIVHKLMYEKDAFSQWLGIEILEVAPGSAYCRMQIREEMTNGFKIAHGGISFSFADSAFAFASNSRGRKAVSIETSISHTQAVQIGEWLYARATEEHLGNRTAVYSVEVSNEKKETVALFKGTVYRTDKEWISET
ncbi:MAG: hydroxyphenylacetyl-CoA thioesterase PaaI [Bacteroidota bacterium]